MHPDWERNLIGMFKGSAKLTAVDRSSKEQESRLPFDDLPALLQHTILGRLPVVSIAKNRLVCKAWNKLLSSHAFATKYWAVHKPLENWLLFHDETNPKDVYFYDIGPNAHYRLPHSSRSALGLGISRLHLCYANTSAVGLMFLYDKSSGNEEFSGIRAINPLTGKSCKIASRSDVNIRDAVVGFMIAKVDTTTKPRPNYKLLTIEVGGRVINNLEQTIPAKLFSSKTHAWEKVSNLKTFKGSRLDVVQRFYDDEDDLVYLVEFFPLKNPDFEREFSREVPGTGGSEGILGEVRWFDVAERAWNSCRIPLIQDNDFSYVKVCVYERNQVLILVAVGTSVDGDDVKIRIYESSSPVGPQSYFHWSLLSEMSNNYLRLFRNHEISLIPQALGAAAILGVKSTLLPYLELKVHPLANAVGGDKMVFVGFSVQQIASFNFDRPPQLSWTTPSNGGLTIRRQVDRRSGWMKDIQTGFRSHSIVGFPFEPRIDVDPCTLRDSNRR